MDLRILLVDGNTTFAVTICQLLGSLPGVRVVGHAQDGDQALLQARQLMPDLVLLDPSMPDMRRLDLARSLQLARHAPHVVFMSMHDGHAYRIAALESGAADFVAKPDLVAQLLPIVERLVSARGHVAESI